RVLASQSSEDLVIVVDVVVDTSGQFIAVNRAGGAGDEVARFGELRTRGIRRGHVIEQAPRDGVEPAGGNRISRESRADKSPGAGGIGNGSKRIVDHDQLTRLVARLREVALPLPECRKRAARGQGTRPSKTLVGREEKRSVASFVHAGD